MLEVLKAIFDAIQGQQVSAVFAFVVILAILGVSGYYIYKFMQSALLNAPEYMRNRKSRRSGVITTTGEEWLKSEEGIKYLDSVIVTHIKLNDERIVEKVAQKIHSELKIQIFEETKSLYERIAKMREEYAGNYATRREIEPLVNDIDEVRLEVAKIKGHLNMD